MNIILKEYKSEKTNNIYKALEDGIYNAKIIDVSIKTSKNNNKMLVLNLELVGEKMLNGAHLGGRKEKYFIMLNDKYAGVKMHSLLEGVGIDVKVGDEINVEQLIISNVLINKQVKIKLEKSNYENKDGVDVECNRVKYLLKAGRQESVIEDVLNNDDIPF